MATELTPGPCPSPWGAPVARARFKATPEDFIVEELLGFEPEAATDAGAGEHLWLWVEKRGLNTDQVGAELARELGVERSLVSYSGLKDRHALTRQWFSIHWHGQGCWSAGDDWQLVPAREASDEPGRYRVLAQLRSGRKLRRGTHAGNRFVITLRDVTLRDPGLAAQAGSRAEIEARLQQLADEGVANYFGLQRFGHGGRNIVQGLGLLADRRAGRRRRRDNRESLWISALRSALFNQVLAARVNAGHWNRCLPGDVLQLDGRGSFFQPDPADPEWQSRLLTGEIHPTGPMPGDGAAVVHAQVAELEAAVLAPWQAICDDLAALRVPALRRALRLRVEGLQWHWPEPQVLTLSFALTSGAFATSVLQSLAELQEGEGDAFSAIE